MTNRYLIDQTPPKPRRSPLSQFLDTGATIAMCLCFFLTVCLLGGFALHLTCNLLAAGWRAATALLPF